MIDTVIHNDCLSVLRGMADNSVDAIVSDPPAGINFMNKPFDDDRGGRDQWVAWLKEIMIEAKRVIRPGGHALIWALPRTSHWTATALEDAGFEVRDKLYHLFGSGFPKSLDIGKAMDRMRHDNPDVLQVTKWLNKQVKRASISYAAILAHFGFNEGSGQIGHWTALSNGAQPTVPTWEQWLELKSLLNLSGEMDAEVWRLNGRKGKPGDAWYEREVIGKHPNPAQRIYSEKHLSQDIDITAPATPEAQRWQGYGTALKPSCEEWILCRKPLAESSIAAQVLATGTGGLNIDACRVNVAEDDPNKRRDTGGYRPPCPENGMFGLGGPTRTATLTQGRFPSHLLLSHSLWCVPRGMKRVRVNDKEHDRHNGARIDRTIYGDYNANVTTGYADSEGYEHVEAYDCAPDCPIAELDRQSGVRKSNVTHGVKRGNGLLKFGGMNNRPSTDTFERVTEQEGYDDQGGASRYFTNFPPDGSVEHSHEGIEDPFTCYYDGFHYVTCPFEAAPFPPDDYTPFLYQSKASRANRSANGTVNNIHPTCKNTELMRWLIRLITPPDGIVLDPFCGSGSTCVAAIHEQKHFIGIEQDESYVNIANARIEYARTHEPDVVQVATKKVRGSHDNGYLIPRNATEIGFTRNGSGVEPAKGYTDSEGMEEVEDWDCAPDCPVRILGEQSGVSKSGAHKPYENKSWDSPAHMFSSKARDYNNEASTGTAARYFQQFAPDLWTQDMHDAEEVFIAEGGYEGEVGA